MPAFGIPLDSVVPLKMEVPLRRDVPLRRECPDVIALLPLNEVPLRSDGAQLTEGDVVDLILLADNFILLLLLLFLLSDRLERFTP